MIQAFLEIIGFCSLMIAFSLTMYGFFALVGRAVIKWRVKKIRKLLVENGYYIPFYEFGYWQNNKGKRFKENDLFDLSMRKVRKLIKKEEEE